MLHVYGEICKHNDALCKLMKQGLFQGPSHKDKDKDKDITCKDKDKDWSLVLKKSLRTRINITGM